MNQKAGVPCPWLQRKTASAKAVPRLVLVAKLHLWNTVVIGAQGDLERQPLGDLLSQKAPLCMLLPITSDPVVHESRAVFEIQPSGVLESVIVLVGLIAGCAKADLNVKATAHSDPAHFACLKLRLVLENRAAQAESVVYGAPTVHCSLTTACPSDVKASSRRRLGVKCIMKCMMEPLLIII